jgi:hypothetical protein
MANRFMKTQPWVSPRPLREVSSSDRRGFVLPTVIFAITIMSVIAIVVLNTSSDERRASRATRESTLAMYAADAGLRHTYGVWPTAAVNAMKPGDSLDLGWQTLPNKAAYRAVIHRVDAGALQEYNVVVQGRRTDPTAGIVTIVSDVGGVPVFKYAVRTESGLYLMTGGVFDSYDSDLGPYGALNVDTTANLWANGDLNVTKTIVNGSAAATGTITLGQNGLVTGGTTSAPAPLPAVDTLPCPTTGFTPAAKVPAGPGISYNSISGVLTVSSGTVTLTDTSYFFASIVLSGNAKLVSGNPQLNIMLRDSLNAASGVISNPTNNASTLSFASCGTSATPAYWALSSGGTASYYTVYAPNHIVYETGAGDFYGAIVASIYYSTGGGRFHYDAALARKPSKKLAVRRGSWAQLPGT